LAKPIKHAIIGCGRVAFWHAEMVKDNDSIKVVACCDLLEDKAKELAKKMNCRAYTNYHEMFAQEKIDLITMATPTGAHYEHVKDILSHYRVHILLEKPMVLRLSQAREIKELADKQGVQIFPVYQNRFNKSVQRVKKALNDGELGDIALATVRVRWCRPQRYYDLAAWRGTFSMDGGAYVNQGIHFMDVLRYLAGEIEEVNSLFGQLGAKLEAEDTGVSLLKFHNGALGQLEITMAARPDDFEASVSIVGSKGLAVLGGLCSNKLITFSSRPEDETAFSEEVPIVYGFGHKELYRRVVKTLLEGDPAPIEFADGLETIRLLHALYRSNEERRWVKLNENVESFRLGERRDDLLIPYLIQPPAKV
jgi:predicted dehydrogenase